jgi:TonB family protein
LIKIKQDTYKNDKKNGLSTVWFDNGNIYKQGNYKEGRFSGEWSIFDRFGALEWKFDYDKDEFLVKSKTKKGSFYIDKTDTVYMPCDFEPEYENGYDSLWQFIAEQIKYPVDCQEKGIQGIVYISYLIDQDGILSEVKVLKSVDPSLDQAAIDVVKKIPGKWIPASFNGQKLCTRMIMPLIFKLE